MTTVSIPNCLPYGTVPNNNYPYQPSLVAGVVFSVSFGTICLAQIYHTIRTRAWWMGFFVAGAMLETLGWVGRATAYSCSYNDTIDTMQIATLIMGPAYTQAGIYAALYVLIRLNDRSVSPIRPSLYLTIIFGVDTVCLSLQAIGGGIAGGASTMIFDNPAQPQVPDTHYLDQTLLGTHIMLAGIVAQLASGLVFAAYLAIVLPRCWPVIKANKSLRLLCLSIVVVTFMMVLRGFYRSVELGQGWSGYLISHQAFIIALDAAPMVVAMGCLALLNPGQLLLESGFEVEGCEGRRPRRERIFLNFMDRKRLGDAEKVEVVKSVGSTDFI